MTPFTFPQPGERTNRAAIPVPEHTLAALLSLAILGRESLLSQGEDFASPQARQALVEVTAALSVDLVEVAYNHATSMRQDLLDDCPL